MTEPLNMAQVRAAAELDMRLSENVGNLGDLRLTLAAMAGRVNALTYLVDRLRAGLANPDDARDLVVGEALRKVENQLGEISYRWSGGLPYVEREQIFMAVHVVAKELFGDRWLAVMSANDVSEPPKSS